MVRKKSWVEYAPEHAYELRIAELEGVLERLYEAVKHLPGDEYGIVLREAREVLDGRK